MFPTESGNPPIDVSPLLLKLWVMARLSRLQTHRFHQESLPSELVFVVPQLWRSDGAIVAELLMRWHEDASLSHVKYVRTWERNSVGWRAPSINHSCFSVYISSDCEANVIKRRLLSRLRQTLIVCKVMKVAFHILAERHERLRLRRHHERQNACRHSRNRWASASFLRVHPPSTNGMPMLEKAQRHSGNLA